MAIENYKLRPRIRSRLKVISRDRDLYVAIDNNSKTKKESYTHLLSRQSKIFGVPMKNIEMSLTGHRNKLLLSLHLSLISITCPKYFAYEKVRKL